MMRDNLRLCSDEVGKRLLESAGDHGMQLGPSALQQTFVGGIANQSMTEAMVLVGADTGCNNQSGSVQFVQCLAKTLLRQSGHCRQQRAIEVPPDARRYLSDSPYWQVIQPGHQ